MPGPEEDREYLLSLLPPVLHRCHLAAAGTNPRDISEHPLGASTAPARCLIHQHSP